MTSMVTDYSREIKRLVQMTAKSTSDFYLERTIIRKLLRTQ